MEIISMVSSSRTTCSVVSSMTWYICFRRAWTWSMACSMEPVARRRWTTTSPARWPRRRTRAMAWSSRPPFVDASMRVTWRARVRFSPEEPPPASVDTRMTAQCGSSLNATIGASESRLSTSAFTRNLAQSTALVWCSRGRNAEKTTIFTGSSGVASRRSRARIAPRASIFVDDPSTVDPRKPSSANWSLGWHAATRSVRQSASKS
mmetsp:Transcript_20859/g.72100  ORF Transcript_20859/g.72100 Transcript_20859/m.72100 type:complete len:206 (+) Transcript_20859:62-679(+)